MPAELRETAREMVRSFEESDLTPVMRWAMNELESLHSQAFQQGRGPGGEVWPELAESTQKRKGHGIKLIEHGDLEDSLTKDIAGEAIREMVSEPAGQGFVFGTRDEKAARHQMGTQRMPARPPVGITDSFVDDLAERTADHLLAEVMGEVDTIARV